MLIMYEIEIKVTEDSKELLDTGSNVGVIIVIELVTIVWTAEMTF